MVGWGWAQPTRALARQQRPSAHARIRSVIRSVGRLASPPSRSRWGGVDVRGEEVLATTSHAGDQPRRYVHQHHAPANHVRRGQSEGSRTNS